jgi:hypothetical protein
VPRRRPVDVEAVGAGEGVVIPVGRRERDEQTLAGLDQLLLRAHGLRLARGDAEERRVERGHVRQEATLPGDASARDTHFRVIHRVHVVTVRRHLPHLVAAVADQPPQLVRAGGARETAAEFSGKQLR